MSLSETDWQHFDNLYAEKQVSIREEHDQKMRAIESSRLHPMELGSTKHLREVQPMERLNMLIEEIKHYAKESVFAFIDAFIEAHKEVDLHPDERDVETFWQRLTGIPKGCIGDVEEDHRSNYSPIPSKVAVNRNFDLLHEELRGYAVRFSPRLQKFLTHSARRKERGLPLNSYNQGMTNTVNVMGIPQAKQAELSEEMQKEPVAKPMENTANVNISERRKNRTLLIVEVYRAANGGRMIGVPLWDIAQKLGISEDEAMGIYKYYQDQYYFKDNAVNRLVHLNHYGIISIENAILESQDPPDLLQIVQKKQELRFLLLKKLFGKAGGSSQKTINFVELAEEEGVPESDVYDFQNYLYDNGFIKFEGMGGRVSITSRGQREIEEWMEAPVDRKQSSQPIQLVNEVNTDSITPLQKLKVFLCHSSRNKQTVSDLYDRLLADGIEPWFGDKSILPGHHVEYEIKKAVRNSDATIVCLSEDAINNRDYFHKEIKFVLDVADEQLEGHIFIIPILLEACEIPERFKHLHCEVVP